MARTELATPPEALHALSVAGFPLLEESNPKKLIKIGVREGGMESYLPARFFMPTTLRLGEHATALHALQTEPWIGSSHAKGVLRGNLGIHSHKVTSYILTELVKMSAAREAQTAVSTARIMVEDGQTIFSVWDDGRPYSGPREIIGIFGASRSMPPSDNAVLPWAVTRTTLSTFGGTLSILSSGSRVDMSDGVTGTNVEVYKVEDAVGNLVIANLPHTKVS